MEEINKPYIFATLEYPPDVGGVASYCYDFVHNVPAGAVEVVTNQKNQLLFQHVWPRWIKAVCSLYTLVQQRKAKGIIVAHVLPIGTAAVLVGMCTSVPVIILVHGLDVLRPQGQWWKKKLLYFVLQRSTRIIANSRYTARSVQLMGIPGKKVSILPLGPHHIPKPDFQPDENWLESIGLTAGQPLLLSVARLVPRKGIDTVIHILPSVLKDTPQVKYIIAGEGPEREKLQQLVVDRGLQKAVIFAGRVSDTQLASLYQRCSVFVLPTREEAGGDVEGFGIVFIEANAFGKPVVAGKSGGVEDAVQDGLNGFLVEPDNPDMLLQALRELLGNPVLAQRLGEQGRQRVQDQFNWKENVSYIAQQLDMHL